MKKYLLLTFLVIFTTTWTYAQQKVTGTIRDAVTGELLSFVSVMIPGTSIGANSTENGTYSITLPTGKNKLSFTYLGYTSQTLDVSGDVLDVALQTEATSLEQVVIVGYGTQKKVNLTGSLSTIDNKILKNRPTSSLASAIQGSMSGVTVSQTSGLPGADRGAGNIRVRGVGTLNNANPMVVVDGIVSSMDDLNPDDIENLTVLKDAASAAIYGSRAANGVILITTKRGKKNSLQMNLSMNVGVQSPTRLIEFLGSPDCARLYNESLVNEGKKPTVSDEDIAKYESGSDPYNYPNTDWVDLLYRGSGLQQNYYLDMTGGSENTRYAFSVGYFDQEGIVKNTDYKRYTGRININSDVKKWLTLNTGISYSVGNTAEPTSSYPGVPGFDQLIRQINRISPMVPYKHENGHYGYINDGSPMAWLEAGGSNRWARNQMLGNLGLEITLLQGLKLKPTIGYSHLSNDQKRFVKDIQYYNKSGVKTIYQGPNNLYEVRSSTEEITLQTLLTYDRSFAKHNISALAGWSRENSDYEWISSYRKNFLNNELDMLNAAPSEGQVAEGSATQIALVSYFSRFNYNYDSRYFLEANVRRDGSSKFAKDNRWGVFPSFSAAWRISEESFFTGMKESINDLKIRVSWGKLGNQYLPTSVGNYPTYAVYSGGQNYNFGNSIAPGMAQTKGANMNLVWEESTNSGIGLDLTTLNQKMTLTIDYYDKLTSGILQVSPVSSTYGLDAPSQNIGDVRNKGLDFSVAYNDHAGKLHYNLAANFGYVDNKVEKLVNNKPVIDGPRVLMEGYSINSYYGYICDGIFQNSDEIKNHATQALGGTTKPGDLKYRDISGPDGKPDGKINGDDRVVLGKTFAPYTFGFNVSLSYGDFDLGIFFQGAAGHYGSTVQNELGTGVGKATPDMLNRWQKEGDSKYPRLLATQKQNLFASNPTDFWLTKRDYLRLKNLQIGYNLPTSILSKLGLQKARIYYSAQNILTLTNFSLGLDPEMPGSIYDHPQVSVNSFGLNVTF